MAKQKDITDRGIPTKSGLEIYVEVEVAEGATILVPMVATDKYGNAHKIYRKDLDNKSQDDEK